MDAKFISKLYDDRGNAILLYGYKGMKYDVVDYSWRGGEPLSWQHKNAQAHIDALLDKPVSNNCNCKPFDFSDIDCLYE